MRDDKRNRVVGVDDIGQTEDDAMASAIADTLAVRIVAYAELNARRQERKISIGSRPFSLKMVPTR